MGRLSEFFDAHRENVEEAVSAALAKADATIETLNARVKELEQRMRDVAGEAPSQDGAVTSSEASPRKQTRTKNK